MSRKWTHVHPVHATTMGHVTPRARGHWALDAAAPPASLDPLVLSSWTSVLSTLVLTGSAAAWATATGVSASQVSL